MSLKKGDLGFRLTQGLTQNTNCSSESCRVSALDEVNKFLHDDVSLALTILDVQDQPVAGQDAGVVVDVLHRHYGHWPELGGREL